MITRGRGRRAHLVVGDPWLDAAAGFLGFGSPDEEPWRLGDGIRTGDLVVTVLDTDPRLLLCVERVDTIEDGGIAVGERWTTSGFPPVDAVDYRFSLHPPCPNCAAHTTEMMCMGFPPDPGPRGFAPWVSMGGCCVGPDTPAWTCGTCHHSW